jgi:hypothetical protein
MESNMAKFVDLYHARIGTAGCTWKFHIFQHFIDLIKIHGSALYWDGFFRECILGELKKFLTGTRGEDEQIVANFLLNRHAKKYFEACEANQRMKDFYESERVNFAGKSMTEIVNVSYESSADMSDNDKEMVFDLFGSSGDEEVKRVTRCRRGGIVLSSKKYAHRGMVDDSWVYESDDMFGQIEDMFVLNERGKSVVLKLRKFEKVPIMDEMSMEGEELLFPKNQFPCQSTGDIRYIFVDDSVVIQKMSVGKYEHEVKDDRDNKRVECTCFVSVWPEVV